jgi:acetyltransferase-like isoleucine patch superfamily enzyme
MDDARAFAAELVSQAIAKGDGTRQRIGSQHWPLPDFFQLQHECIENNHVFWAGQKPQFKIVGNGNVIVLGKIDAGDLKGAVLGSNNVVLALGETSQFRLRIDIHGNGAFLYVGPGTRIISAHVVLGKSDMPTSVLIGAQSLLSRQVTLRATDSHSIIDIASGTVINEPESIVVEPHVWIGENATLLKGCSVGAGSIVAAAALVTGDLPACSTCGGIPAKVLRAGTTWTSSPQPTPRQLRTALDYVQSVIPPEIQPVPQPEETSTIQPDKLGRRIWSALTRRVPA